MGETVAKSPHQDVIDGLIKIAKEDKTLDFIRFKCSVGLMGHDLKKGINSIAGAAPVTPNDTGMLCRAIMKLDVPNDPYSFYDLYLLELKKAFPITKEAVQEAIYQRATRGRDNEGAFNVEVVGTDGKKYTIPVAAGPASAYDAGYVQEHENLTQKNATPPSKPDATNRFYHDVMQLFASQPQDKQEVIAREIGNACFNNAIPSLGAGKTSVGTCAVAGRLQRRLDGASNASAADTGRLSPDSAGGIPPKASTVIVLNPQ